MASAANAEVNLNSIAAQYYWQGGLQLGPVSASITSAMTGTTGAAGEGCTIIAAKASGLANVASLHFSKFTATVTSGASAPVATGIAGTAWAPTATTSQFLGFAQGDPATTSKIYRLMMDASGNITVQNLTGVNLATGEKFTLVPFTVFYRVA